MKLLFILVGYIIHSKVSAGEIAEQFNQLAQSFCECIYEPTKEKWDQMLEDMNTYNLELGNLVLKLNEDMGDVMNDAEELYNEGMPTFVELPFSEPDVEKDGGITKAQIQKLHVLRDEILNMWEDFAEAFVRKTQTDHF